MSATVFVITGLTIATVAGLKWYFSAEQVTRRALGRVAATSVSDAREGTLVKLVGRVVPSGDALAAPLSARACVAWTVTIQLRRGSGKNKRWRDVHHGGHHVSFVIEDPSGRARVDVTRARVVLKADHYGQRGGWSDDATDALLAYCAENGVETSNFLGFDVPVRSREGVLEPSETVAVMGVARFEDDPTGASESYRGVAKRLVIVAPDDAPVLLSDHDDTH